MLRWAVVNTLRDIYRQLSHYRQQFLRLAFNMVNDANALLFLFIYGHIQIDKHRLLSFCFPINDTTKNQSEERENN